MEGELRLRDGEAPRKGRLEIFHHDAWGTICDSTFDLDDANVVCRQLGFPGADKVASSAYTTAGKGPSHLQQVDCMGTEEKLTDCQGITWNEEDCGHDNDVGVICNSSKESLWRYSLLVAEC